MTTKKTKKATSKETESALRNLIINLDELLVECEKLQTITAEMLEKLAPPTPPATATNAQLINLIEMIQQDITEQRIHAELRNYRDNQPTPAPRTRKDFE
jgi:hypothetical protein